MDEEHEKHVLLHEHKNDNFDGDLLKNKSNKIDDEKLESMNKRWHEIENKYSWRKSNNCCILFWYKLYYFVTGSLVVLFITLPLMLTILLFILFFFILWLFTCCHCCKYKSFIDYFRKFIGNQRLHLCTYCESEKGILWHIRNRIIGFYQFLEMIQFSKTLYQHSIIYKKVYENDDVYPYLFGIATTKYDEIYNELYDQNNIRSGLAGFDLQPDHDNMNYYYFAHNMSTHDVGHEIGKDIANIIADVSHIDINDDKQYLLPDNYLKSYFEKLIKDNDFEISGVIWYAMYLYFLFGARFSDEELEKLKSPLFYSGFTVFPSWIHFLFANNALNRGIYDCVQFFGEIIIKYGGNKYKRIVSYCNNRNIDSEIGLVVAAHSILIIGGRRISWRALQRFKSNPQLEINLFKTKPMIYVYETIRYKTSPALFANRSKTERKYMINGKEFTFPINTIICCPNGYINKFTSNDQFSCDHQLDEYKKCILFHSKENGYYHQKDLAPRYCPGHDAGLLFLKAFITKLHSFKIH